MTHYFVDNRAQPDGAHEVHAVGCKRMASDKAYLGDYFSCEQAVLEARKTFWYIAGCVRCMTESDPAATVRVAQIHFDFPALRAATGS
jgi:hypothetical protein